MTDDQEKTVARSDQPQLRASASDQRGDDRGGSRARRPPTNASPEWWSKRTVMLRNRGSRPVVCPFCKLEIVNGQRYYVAWSGVYGAHVDCVNKATDGNQASTQSSGVNLGSAAQKSSSHSSTDLLGSLAGGGRQEEQDHSADGGKITERE